MKSTLRTRAGLLGTTVLAGVGLLMASAPAVAQDSTEVVTVTGYRASLTDSTNAKRASVGFSDTVFAEDIGKFPDANIAESLQRVPGINITREADGEGLQVAIRGLGTNFTKITLNGNPIAVASTGGTDSNNTNREVDLNMFPTELFTQLSVAKSPTPDLIEGGLAGNVNMRSARPFDNEGMHVTYNLQGTEYSKGATLGQRGTLLFSDTEGAFGALVGASIVHNKMYTTGWEDGNAGYYTPGLTAAQCGTNATATFPTCNVYGNAEWTIPATIPAGINIPIPGGSGYYAAGTVIDQAWLAANNPAVTSLQIAKAMVPRLGREMYENGARDRANAIVSLEYRPSDNLHFYFDTILGRTVNVFDRSDMDFALRSGGGYTPTIPVGMKVDGNGVLTDGRFYNSSFFLESRPYTEKGDFLSFNPGMTWQVTELLKIEAQAYATRSHFFRDQSDLLVMTSSGTGYATGVTGPAAPSGGAYTDWSNHGAYPIVKTNVDLNNPANFSWASNIGGSNGRVDLAVEKRYTFTDGYRLDASYGGDEFSVKAGGGFNNVFRNIAAVAGGQTWQNAVCGDGPSLNVPGQASYPPCQGLNDPTPNAAGHTGGYPTYPGIGTGYTAGMTGPVTYSGSLIPNSKLASELMPGPRGWATVNKNQFFADSQYYKWQAFALAGLLPSTLTGADGVKHPNEVTYGFAQSTVGNQSTGQYEEKIWDLYAEAAGKLDIYGHSLAYNAGLRWVETHEIITSAVVDGTVTPQNVPLADGGKYPGRWQWTPVKSVGQAFLPSANIVFEVVDDLQFRASASRTMSRANPTQMVSTVSFGDVLARTANLGNPSLKPYFSNNVDLGLNYYTGGEGYLAVTAFKKSVSGYTGSGHFDTTFSYLADFGITYASLSQTQKDNLLTNSSCNSDATCASAPLTVNRQVNLPGTLRIQGLEFDVVQPLDFLTESFGVKGFGVNGNATFLDQSSSGAAPAVAGGVPPITFNATAYYEDDGVMVRMSYAFTSKNHGQNIGGQVNLCFPDNTYKSTAAGCQGPWYYNAAHEQVDVSSSLKLSKLFGELPTDPELTFDIQNLTRAKLRTYDMYPNAPHTYYDPGSYYMLGLRGSF